MSGAALRAVIYGRVSTEDQVEGTSLDDQRRICRQAIEQRGWRLVDEYIDEGVTGTKRERPQWQRMLADIAQGKVDAVVVSKLDRFARNAGHAITETDALANLGVQFVSVKENIDLSTAHGRMMRTMLAGFAELERDTIVERTVAGQRAKGRQGRWPGGSPAFGWRLEGKGRDAHPVPDEREREIITAVHAWLVRDGLTTGQVSDRLNALGMRPRIAARWQYEVVRRVFTNPTLYTGVTVWGAPDTRRSGHHTRTTKDGSPKYGDPIPVDLGNPPLAKRQHEAIKRAIARNGNGRVSQQRVSRELTGRLLGGCGKPYTGVTLSHREYDAYRCTGRRHRGVSTPRCSCPEVHAEVVEQRVWDQVVALLGDVDRLRAMARQWVQISAGDETGGDLDDRAVEAVEQQIERLERGRTNAAREVLMATDPAPFREAVAQIEADLDRARARLEAMVAIRADAEGRAKRLSNLATLAEAAAERLPRMDAQSRREVLALLGVKVTMDEIEGGVPHSLTIEGQVDPRLFEGGSGTRSEGPDGGSGDGSGTHSTGDDGPSRVPAGVARAGGCRGCVRPRTARRATPTAARRG